jgi:TatD DNase family protein
MIYILDKILILSNKNSYSRIGGNMQIIDTHIHPELIKNFQKKKNNTEYSYEELIEDSKKNAVVKMFCIATEIKNFDEYSYLATLFKEFYFSIGIHPTELLNNTLDDSLLELAKKIIQEKKNNNKLIGIGETGFDFFHTIEKEAGEMQEKAFHFQIEQSIKSNLPLIIHTRNATEKTYQVLSQYKGKIKGTIHAFQDTAEWAKKFVDLGFMLGIGGVITYPKNEHIREAIQAVGIEHIILETDSPFLPPQSQRGKINLPKNCYEIGCIAAKIIKKNEECFFEKIFENTVKLFLS